MNLDGCWDNVNLPQNDEQSNLDKDIVEEENGVKTFRVKDYIPKRSATKFLKQPYIIGIAIIFILMIIIIILASLKNKSAVCDSPNEIADGQVFFNVSTQIILLDKNRFFIYDPNKASLNLLLELKNPVRLFDIDASRKTLFWIEANSSNIMSFGNTGNKTDKDVNIVFDEKRIKPCSIALDSIRNNLYVVDESIQGLIVINMDTKYFALLLLNIMSPRYVALDAVKGIIFFASEKEIRRTDMDGKNMKYLISNKAISAITLDRKEERVYWITNYEVIESSDYFGNFTTGPMVIDSVTILDFTVLDGYLFWLRKPSGSVNTTLWSCKIRGETCDDHAMLSDAVGTSTLITLSGHTQQIKLSSSQNTSNRKKCEHIALATPESGQVTCVCNMSSQLIFNKKCEPVSEFILYTMKNITRTRLLDVSQRIVSEPFWPTPYRIGNLSSKSEIDFDYDFENGDFYFSDDNTIYKIKLKAKNPQQEVVLVNNDFYIEDLAYDWLTGNMYFSKRSNKYNGKHALAVFNVKKGQRFVKTLKYFDYDMTFGMEASAYGLAVYPSRGTLYFTAGENGRRYIFQTTANGTVVSQFTNVRYVHEYRLIAVDYEKDRLYWISSDSTVTHANFDGTDRKDVSSRKMHRAKTISISRQWMYLSDSDDVWRLDKETGEDYSRISPLDSQRVSGARVISQRQLPENPCRRNNGGCEQFCFYGANANCDCADHFRVQANGACK